MHANAQRQETIVKLVPGGDQSLAHLSDSEILTTTRRLVGSSNRLFAMLLLHLAEVETRGIHFTRACASLYTYCIYELRMSEDAAARRSSAAKWVKRFPALFDAVESGELHLTGLLMLAPHLTLENHVDVLARAKFRTKKEIAKLVRELHPLPRVPDVIEPLRPELPRKFHRLTYDEWVTSLAPPVRELKPGERPRDWANDTTVLDGREAEGTQSDADDESRALHGLEAAACSSAARDEAGAMAEPAGAMTEPASAMTELAGAMTEPAGAMAEPAGAPVPHEGATEPLSAAPARLTLPPITGPQQYQLQFCTTEEHVKLIERAKALLARTSPGASLGELHLRAMKLLVEKSLRAARSSPVQRARHRRSPPVTGAARPSPAQPARHRR